jgi:uncharacterized protein YqhQ
MTSKVVRKNDQTLAIETQKYIPLKQRFPILGIPLIRGCASLVISMKDGMGALMWSADFFAEDEAPKTEEAVAKQKKSDKAAMTIAVFLGLVLAIGLFSILPTWTAGLLGERIGSGVLRTLLETGIRLVILVGYLLVVSSTKDIKRVYSYHGAEHKTIACYEAGEELTVENVKKYTRFHPRCGTSFLLMVVIISLAVFLAATWLIKSYVPALKMDFLPVRLLVHLVIFPFVVGLAYETNRFIGAHDNFLTRILRFPGLLLQRITTREPDDSMMEVGIEALTLVIPVETGSDAWGKE